MYRTLKNFLSTVNQSIKKEDVSKVLDMVFTSMHDDIIPTLDTLVREHPGVINESNYLTGIARDTSLKGSKNIDFIKNLSKLYSKILKEEKNIENLVNKELSEYVTTRSAMAKDVAILKLVSDLSSLTQYTPDLVYYILLNKGDTEYPKIKLNDIRVSVGDFTVLVNTFNKNFKDYVKNVQGTADEDIVRDKVSDNIMNKLLNNKGKYYKLPTTSNFLANPVYHIRMWFIDREIEKYELLKEKKKLVELKLLELKLEKENDNNPKLKQQIQYYEEKIATMEYKIKEIDDGDEAVSSYIPVVI